MPDKLPSVRMPLDRGGKTSREFAHYLEQIKHESTSSPTFVGLDLTGITDSNIPYMSATGFADSPLTTDGTDFDFGSGDLASIGTVGCGAITSTGASSITFDKAGLHILDTDSSHDLIITPGSDLDADKVLTLTTGNAARTITLSGNPTLADWFDQAVKGASNVNFGTITGSGNLTATGNVGVGGTTWGTSADNVLGIATGTAPTTSPANMVQLYSFDRSAGYAQLHYRAEGGLARPLQQVFNVMDYGAHNDNSDAAGTKTAIDAAVSAAITAGGGVISFPQGIYALVAGISVTTDKCIVFQGVGGELSEIRGDHSGGAFVTITITKTGASQNIGSGLDGLYIDGGSINNGGTGVKFGLTLGCFVNNCKFANLDTGIQVGEIDSTDLSQKMLISDIEMSDVKYGIYLGAYVELTVNDFWFDRPGGTTGVAAIYGDTTSLGAASQADGINIDGLYVLLAHTNNIKIDFTDAATVGNIGNWTRLTTNLTDMDIKAGKFITISNSIMGSAVFENVSDIMLTNLIIESDTDLTFTNCTRIQNINNYHQKNGSIGASIDPMIYGATHEFYNNYDDCNLIIKAHTDKDPILSFYEVGTEKWKILNEHTADQLQFATGAGVKFRVDTSGNIAVPATEGVYLDGLGNTYISEVSADVINFVCGGNEEARLDANGLFIGSDTANNVYTYDDEINFCSGTNGNDAGYINTRGYNVGQTQFRDLYIQDGKGASLVVIDGSAGTVLIDDVGTIGSNIPLLNLRADDGNPYLLKLDSGGALQVSCSVKAGPDVSATGAWSDDSTRSVKHDFEVIDGGMLLEKLKDLEISKWSRKKDPESQVRHFGPFAEDVYSEFGIGDGKGIAPGDTAGLALAMSKELLKRIEVLEAA